MKFNLLSPDSSRKPMLCEIIEAISEESNLEGKIKIIKSQIANRMFGSLMRLWCDERITMKITKVPKYSPSPYPIAMGSSNPYVDWKRLYLFYENSRSLNLTPEKVNKLLIQMLEGYSTKDALYFAGIITRTLSIQGFNQKFVLSYFPNWDVIELPESPILQVNPTRPSMSNVVAPSFTPPPPRQWKGGRPKKESIPNASS